VFPISLLSTVINAIIAAISQNATDKIMSGTHDSSRKFGRELLDFYEDLQDYADRAQWLIVVIERSDFTDTSTRSYNHSIGEINRIAHRLAAITGQLVGRFCPPTHDGDDIFYANGKWQPSKRALRRGAIVDVFDPQLVVLARTAYSSDMTVASMAAQIAKLHIDEKQSTVTTFIPHQNDIMPLLSRMGYRYQIGGYGLNQKEFPTGVITRASLGENPHLVDEIVDLIRNNIDMVIELRGKVRELLREHFTIIDLL